MKCYNFTKINLKQKVKTMTNQLFYLHKEDPMQTIMTFNPNEICKLNEKSNLENLKSKIDTENKGYIFCSSGKFIYGGTNYA